MTYPRWSQPEFFLLQSRDHSFNATEHRLRLRLRLGQIRGHLRQRLALFGCRQEVLRADAVGHAIQACERVLRRAAEAAATTATTTPALCALLAADARHHAVDVGGE